jgi:hypothetical protein
MDIYFFKEYSITAPTSEQQQREILAQIEVKQRLFGLQGC